MIQLKSQVDQLINKHLDNRGYINWYHYADFIYEINQLIEEKVLLLIDKGYCMQAFDLTNYIMQCVGDVDYDDSEGELSEVFSDCYDSWKKIINVCSLEEKESIYQWLIKHHKSYYNDEVCLYIEDFLIYEYKEPKLIQTRLDELDEMIENGNNQSDSENYYSSHFGVANLVIKRLEFMKLLDYSKQQIDEYKKQHRNFGVIRQEEINEYVERGQYNDAITVLKESKLMDKK